MKYVSIALNKTGPNPESCSILSIGAIIEDTSRAIDFDDIPKFQGIIGHNGLLTISPPFYDRYRSDAQIVTDYMEVSAYSSAAERNDFMLHNKIVLADELASRFHKWVFENYGEKMPDRYEEEKAAPIKINIAGKNFHQIDALFLSRINGWDDMIKYNGGQLDPSLFYCKPEDNKLPSFQECLERAELYGSKEENRSALTKAWKTVRLLREKL